MIEEKKYYLKAIAKINGWIAIFTFFSIICMVWNLEFGIKLFVSLGIFRVLMLIVEAGCNKEYSEKHSDN